MNHTTTQSQGIVLSKSTIRISTAIAQVRREMDKATGDEYSTLCEQYDRLQQADSYGYTFVSDVPFPLFV